jgi:hypothetical protein
MVFLVIAKDSELIVAVLMGFVVFLLLFAVDFSREGLLK